MKLINLFIQPRKFFSEQAPNRNPAAIAVGAWIVGAAAAADQIDKKLLQSDLKGQRNDALVSITESWTTYWATVLALGIMWSIFLWFAGGWWYRKRLEWSSASEPDKGLARATYVYQSLVHAIPTIVIAVVYTIGHPNYWSAWQAPTTALTLTALAALFLSCWTSFVGATTAFRTTTAKAFGWFFLLPTVLYAAVFGVMTRLLG